MTAWHKEHDAELNRAVGRVEQGAGGRAEGRVPREVIADQIDAVYASLKPAYEDYMKRLSAELDGGAGRRDQGELEPQPGHDAHVQRVYLEIVPDLTAKDKEVIKARMLAGPRGGDADRRGQGDRRDLQAAQGEGRAVRRLAGVGQAPQGVCRARQAAARQEVAGSTIRLSVPVSRPSRVAAQESSRALTSEGGPGAPQPDRESG